MGGKILFTGRPLTVCGSADTNNDIPISEMCTGKEMGRSLKTTDSFQRGEEEGGRGVECVAPSKMS